MICMENVYLLKNCFVYNNNKKKTIQELKFADFIPFMPLNRKDARGRCLQAVGHPDRRTCENRTPLIGDQKCRRIPC